MNFSAVIPVYWRVKSSHKAELMLKALIYGLSGKESESIVN